MAKLATPGPSGHPLLKKGAYLATSLEGGNAAIGGEGVASLAKEKT